jgi:hypothetical protein
MFREVKTYQTSRTRLKIFFIMLLVVISMAGATALLPDEKNTEPDHGEAPVIAELLGSEAASQMATLPGYDLEIFDLSLPEEHQVGELVESQIPVNEEMLPPGIPIQECLAATIYDENDKAWKPIPFLVDAESKNVTFFIDRSARLAITYFPGERSAIKDRLPEFDGLGGTFFNEEKEIQWTNGWDILNLRYGLAEASVGILSGIPDKEAVARVELLLSEVDAVLADAVSVKDSPEMELRFAAAEKLDAAVLALKQELNKEYVITVELDFYDKVNDLALTKASLRNRQGEITQSMSFDANGQAIFALTLFEFLKTGGPTEVAVLVPAHPGYKEFKATLSYRLTSPQISLRARYLTPSQKR